MFLVYLSLFTILDIVFVDSNCIGFYTFKTLKLMNG